MNRAPVPLLPSFVIGAWLLSACAGSASLVQTVTTSPVPTAAALPTESRPSRVPMQATSPVAAGGSAPTAERTYEIVTLLPRDAIPAIDNPRFYTAAEADREYAPDELVLGVSLNGESHAYSTSHLDRHEIVNDTVGGHKIAVTW